MSSISQAEDFVDSVQDLSSEDKNHLKTLLDRGAVVPDAMLGRTPESLRGVIFRNPLAIAGKSSCC
jgi:hypothetical protein